MKLVGQFRSSATLEPDIPGVWSKFINNDGLGVGKVKIYPPQKMTSGRKRSRSHIGHTTDSTEDYLFATYKVSKRSRISSHITTSKITISDYGECSLAILQQKDPPCIDAKRVHTDGFTSIQLFG